MSSKLLTPTRLFSDPPLSGGIPNDVKFSPDGSFVSYRRAASDDRERMDLWKVDLATSEHSLWIDARVLSQGSVDPNALTAEERAERERKRQFSHGISQYIWHPDGEQLLLPVDGQALLANIATEHPKLTPVCPPKTRQSGFQLSPNGRFLSYVRAGDLFITDIDSSVETRLTSDGSATLKNGLPDFLAAEEMHRYQGHWWSPDEQTLAFCRVDEAPVQISHRLEMSATGARTVEQRYPYAGADNPLVELWLASVETGACRCIWPSTQYQACQTPGPQDAYLARVHMGADEVVIQTQDRLQQALAISSYQISSASWQQLYTESSSTWINLTDDLCLLDDQRILFSSESSGTRQAMLLQRDGTATQLPSPTHINAILEVSGDVAYASGWDSSPTENHLFAISLTGKPWQRLTTDAGWHEIVVDTNSARYLDRFTSEHTVAALHVCELSSDSAPAQIYTENITSEHPYAPYLASHAYAEYGELTAEDGQRLCYRLTPPAAVSGQHPTIVYVYGGPGAQKVRREWSPLTVQMFAQNGFAVLELDNRGSTNRGRAFEAPIYRHLGRVEVADQVKGLAALEGHAWADLSRVGIFGHSYGGYMSLMCLAHASEHFSAGVAVAPVSDWQLYDTHYTERYLGLPTDNVDGYAQSNVLPHLHKLHRPLLLMHGMADDNVLFTHSTLIMSELQKLGTPFELMTYPGAKHSMQEREVSIHRFNMILDFFQRHLGKPATKA